MSRNLPVLIAIVAVIGLLSVYFNSLSEQEEQFTISYKDREAVRAGRILYADNCASCHGKRLEGEPNWRSRNADGTLPAPPHTEEGHTWHHPDFALFQTVKYGGQSDSSIGFISNMPAYDELLTDKEIHDILAFIKSNWPANIQAGHDAMNKRIMEQ
ncbi:c-type cytochrome [Curvivirga aplysinae]|uniref:c-type cytochrome n=1 Tax=Curvivirga aplysinae TaxID=2529852 RepID=UPI0012BCEE8B|nr:cytochrome c [Curvivirga aplysinae]MTI10842.1 cytochrome c [Curvivirga aplysinae]